MKHSRSSSVGRGQFLYTVNRRAVRGLEGWDQLLELVKRHAREIQELHRAGLQLREPSTSHRSGLLSLSRDVRGASYQKESGINSPKFQPLSPGASPAGRATRPAGPNVVALRSSPVTRLSRRRSDGSGDQATHCSTQVRAAGLTWSRVVAPQLPQSEFLPRHDCLTRLPYLSIVLLTAQLLQEKPPVVSNPLLYKA